MTATWMLNGFNLIFIVPLLLALVYLGLYTFSGWTFGDADVDADVDHDVEHDVDHDVDHDVEHDADHDHAVGGGNGSGVLAVLSFFGLGRVPLSVLLMILLMSWGVIGFAANSYARENLPALAPHPWVLSVPLAAAGSLLFTKLFAGLVGRYLPTNETYARRRHELLGSVGETVLPTDKTFGMVAVRDNRGELFQHACRLEAGDRTIPKGTKVKLVAYNANERMFYVIEDEFGDARARRDPARADA